MLARSVAVLAFALTPQLCLAQSDTTRLRALEGLKAVRVRVGVIPIATHGRDFAIDTSRLRQQIEGRLTSAGLVVSDTASAEFIVGVVIQAVPTDLFIDGFDMKLIDEVAVTRRVTSGPFRATLWERRSTDAQGQPSTNVAARLTTNILGFLNSFFLPEYRAANPPGR
jgi:hypothetical protein